MHGQRGYACIASDMGHQGASDDVLWASNNLQAQIDFGFRATHVATLAGKAIAERFYGKSPDKSYFVGCSTGGYQGVTEAQRFPWDFDGILAGAPDIDESGANLRALWTARSSVDGAGQPLLTREILRLVHQAALARCDKDDGVKDGIIGNALGCDFDPRELVCRDGKTRDCLTAPQAEAVYRLYSGPMTSKGSSISTGGLPRGSELLWATSASPQGIEQYFRHGISGFTADRAWKYTDFDFDGDYKRFGMAAYYDNSNPDLRRFKRAGGKLIIYQGGNDSVDLPGPVVDYYETVEKTLGGRAATQNFFRLFLVPGMNHCTGGDGAFAIDYLTHLEAWVELGRAPDKMIGAHVSNDYLLAQPSQAEWAQTREEKLWAAAFGSRLPLDPSIPVSFTRPIYPYPLRAIYPGHGNPNDAASFVPTDHFLP
jgi:Tannase and feruloyl esterase